jgi:hypothetical protein
MTFQIKYSNKCALIDIVKKPESYDNTKPIVKYDLSFDNLSDLELLLTMSSEEKLMVNNIEMDYQSFKDNFLTKVHRIYLSKDSKGLDNLCY